MLNKLSFDQNQVRKNQVAPKLILQTPIQAH